MFFFKQKIKTFKVKKIFIFLKMPQYDTRPGQET